MEYSNYTEHFYLPVYTYKRARRIRPIEGIYAILPVSISDLRYSNI